eukprot:845181-Prorocentrum_minimum.AAC.2
MDYTYYSQGSISGVLSASLLPLLAQEDPDLEGRSHHHHRSTIMHDSPGLRAPPTTLLHLLSPRHTCGWQVGMPAPPGWL